MHDVVFFVLQVRHLELFLNVISRSDRLHRRRLGRHRARRPWRTRTELFVIGASRCVGSGVRVRRSCRARAWRGLQMAGIEAVSDQRRPRPRRLHRCLSAVSWLRIPRACSSGARQSAGAASISARGTAGECAARTHGARRRLGRNEASGARPGGAPRATRSRGLPLRELQAPRAARAERARAGRCPVSAHN